MKEQLSAYMDNELSGLEERRLFAALETDAGLRHAWERYHLIRAALRKEGLALVPRMAERVAQTLPERSATAAKTRFLARALGGLALAATVAAIAVFGLQILHQPDPSTSKVAASAQTPARTAILRAGITRWDTEQPEIESALNVYLVEHNEFAPTSGMGGLLPYVRVVGYDSQR